MLVPLLQPINSWLSRVPPDRHTHDPNSSCSRLVRSSTCATAAIEANASPLKPMVDRLKRSSACRILEVAWGKKAVTASSADMPMPLSITWIRVLPASLMCMSIWVLPASMAFSTNSFTTDAGRCTTSPAAIWLATTSGSTCMQRLSDIIVVKHVCHKEQNSNNNA